MRVHVWAVAHTSSRTVSRNRSSKRSLENQARVTERFSRRCHLHARGIMRFNKLCLSVSFLLDPRTCETPRIIPFDRITRVDILSLQLIPKPPVVPQLARSPTWFFRRRWLYRHPTVLRTARTDTTVVESARSRRSPVRQSAPFSVQ